MQPKSLAVASATPAFPGFISEQNSGGLIIRDLELEPLGIFFPLLRSELTSSVSLIANRGK
jgi:hypothetical protein